MEFQYFLNIRSNNIRNLNTFRAPDRCAIEKPKEFQYFLIIRSKNIRNLNSLCVVLNIEFQYKTEQNGIRCTGSQKCSQRFEIDHFCPGNISAIQSLKFFVNPIRESFVSQLNVRLQILKFMVPAQGYVIMSNKKSLFPTSLSSSAWSYRYCNVL